MLKSYLFVFLWLIGYSAIAQSDYLITTKSDTIKGDLRILSYDQLDRVQIAPGGKKQTYTALQVLLVSNDQEFYKPVQMEKTIRLMKVVRSGYLSLYGFKLPNQSTFDGRYLVKMDGSSMELPNLGFKKIMESFLEDCKELSEKVKNGELPKSKIEDIVDQYNACLLNQKPAVQEPIVSLESPGKTNELEAIQNLKNKISEQNFTSKNDALDILRDLESKVGRNENISNYLLEGLQSALKDQAALSEDLSKLIVLLKK